MKKIKLFMMAAFAFSICVGVGGIKSYAKVNSILVRDTNSQKIYEYNYGTLSSAFEDSMMGNVSPLYNDYLDKIQKFGVYGIYDDTSKYVDFTKVEEAFSDAEINEKPFDINAFTSSANAPLLATTPTTLTDVSVGSNGTVTYNDKTVGTDPNSDGFSVISIE